MKVLNQSKIIKERRPNSRVERQPIRANCLSITKIIAYKFMKNHLRVLCADNDILVKMSVGKQR